MNTIDLRDKDLATLRDVFARFPGVREVRLFGSRATGAARRASDIDLAVIAPSATMHEWSDLCEAIEEAPIILRIDLVRVDGMVSESLRMSIARDGIVVYQRAESSVAAQ